MDVFFGILITEGANVMPLSDDNGVTLHEVKQRILFETGDILRLVIDGSAVAHCR